MEIIPAIDIRGGKCVRLVQGDYDRETVFSDDPLAMASRWRDEGARRLHVVDLDGAKERVPVNEPVVARIVAECAGLAVQVAGGMRDEAVVDRWIEAGAARVVIGTLATEDAGAIERLVARHGDRIAVSVDARDGLVAVRGWIETSGLTVDAFVRDMAARGARHFIYTDIRRDGMMEHVDTAHLATIAALVREATATSHDVETPLIIAGGITTLDDIISVAELDVEGVISGRALYDGTIDLREARRALAIGDDW